MKIFIGILSTCIVIFISIFSYGWQKPALRSETNINRVEVKIENELAPFKEFVVTGYYKPLKRQKKYYFGSYLEDIRVNGKGIVTFTGYKPRVGLIAADPKVLPFGSIVDIPDYGIGEVQDIGSQIKGNRIDVFMGAGDPALKRAKNWGKKTIPVKIVWLAKN
jgi:3D (Asp-Asp-Asp) domain-containing protein